MQTSDNLNLDHWRSVMEHAQKDSEWVAFHRDRDQRRLVVRTQMLELLQRFLSAKCSLEEFRATFDLKTRKEWDGFGLKGMSGAMFLNTLVKHLPDQDVLAQRLRSAVALPATPEQGRQSMEAFLAYLNEAIRTGTVTTRQIQPARLSVFLSAWWHMQHEQMWPIYYQSMREALERTGSFKESGHIVADYFRFRDTRLALAEALQLAPWELEHLLSWYLERGGEGVVVPSPKLPVPPVPPPGPDQPATEASEDASHTQIQWLLAKIGKRVGCGVWVAANDHGKTWNGERLGDLSLRELPTLGLDVDAQNIIRLIDVVWIKGARQVVAALEIESTTSVYSGLLRLSDLTVSVPNLNFDLYIVAPQGRLDKVKRELLRPTFQYLELADRCLYFSFERIVQESEAILRWASDPSAIKQLATKAS
jgi:hypothetical protein